MKAAGPWDCPPAPDHYTKLLSPGALRKAALECHNSAPHAGERVRGLLNSGAQQILNRFDVPPSKHYRRWSSVSRSLTIKLRSTGVC